LFVTWSGGGNVHPLVALGGRLQARGHDVRVLGPESLRERFASEGLELRAHRDGAAWTGGDPIDWPTPPTATQQMAYVRGLADDVATELAARPADVVVVDYMQPEALSAVQRAGLPLVAFVHTLYARVAVGPYSPMSMVGSLVMVNALRAELGLPAAGALPELLDVADRVLVLSVEELDRPDGPVPANVRYIGPIVEDPGPDAGWTPPWDDDGRPVVHACTSTVASTDEAAPVLQRVLDAAEALPVWVFVTATEEVRAQLVAPANAILSGYVRHSALLPHVDLFVTHAGLGSVSAGLTYGVPMVCLPLFYEQPDNAAHAGVLGVARTAAPDSSVDELRAVLAAALVDDEQRAVARRVAASVAAHGDRAIVELELLLAAR
jgi:UDP:flavonoid glycosyltransferase YjiC (YdhE family)